MQHGPIERAVCLSLGLTFTAIGLVGAVLPVLPTTPFMILAALCFAKSSPRLHDWLYNHRVFGPSLRQWAEHRVIPPLAKAAALGAMGSSLAYIIAFTQTPWPFVVGTSAIMAFGALYILSKPSRVPVVE